MKIRRLQYNIDYIHILTFKEEYKKAIAATPYFAQPKVEYAIENENTINESFKLIFRKFNYALFIRKEGISFIYEGDVSELKKQNDMIDSLFEVYAKIKEIFGFKKCTRHSLIINAIDILPDADVEELLETSPYFTINPFGKLNEFACIYETKNDSTEIKFSFGNFSQRDIQIQDLMPFKTDFNQDLISNAGIHVRLEYFELELTPSFSKFKTLLSTSEKLISSYKLK